MKQLFAILFTLLLIIWTLLGSIFYLNADIYCVKPALKVAIICGPGAWVIYTCEAVSKAGQDYQLRHIDDR